jgi:hypothetical protein
MPKQQGFCQKSTEFLMSEADERKNFQQKWRADEEHYDIISHYHVTCIKQKQEMISAFSGERQNQNFQHPWHADDEHDDIISHYHVHN